MNVIKQEYPLVVAHRGASGITPENTLAAFKRAAAQGADMIELDVRMTKDFHVVVHHDQTIRRTTGGRGAIWDLTLQQIRNLDAGRWFHSRFSGQQIPTLRQALEAIPSHMGVNIEVKTDGDSRKKLAFEEVTILIIMEKRCVDRVLVSSFDHSFIARVKKLFPEIRTGSLSHPIRDRRRKPSTLARKLKTDAFICDRAFLTADFVADAHARNLLVGSYVINTKAELETAVSLGVDAIVTDFPGRIVPALRRMGIRNPKPKQSGE
ncbi:MAG: glycerophosphodiester phosphodiesterase family protein [Ignavibacteria bacterium]|nr:glycerophosphodiester phosphodiesterase family protein [Ignavibacteria bacterium]